MIDVDRLTKRYGRFIALDSISFRADSGEIVGFLGPNGAGKTTTMRVLTGYMPPTEGTARIAGFDVLTDSLAVRERVGYLPETVRLYREMTVRGYLKFMGQLRGVDRLGARLDEVLDLVGLRERARRLVSSLSKGMQQRLGLAQAILHDPPVLILDEPTIGLDPHQVQELRALIRELGRTRTVLLSTHILTEAEQICDRVIIIDRGRIVAEDTPANLREGLARSSRLYVRVGVARDDVAGLLASVPGVTGVGPAADGFLLTSAPQAGDVRPAVASAIVGQGWPLLELRPWATTLEEIFLELTARLDAPVSDDGEARHA
ncbi:MAG: ATP-binding cassette domain-containing protein [Anaerolineae bacterium]|nr:ATP-binding cassette domain-containing protein [Anaerolineae bacterium]